MIDLTFRLFELNRRAELMGNIADFNFSDLEKEGLFLLRDECKKFELSEMLQLRKPKPWPKK